MIQPAITAWAIKAPSCQTVRFLGLMISAVMFYGGLCLKNPVAMILAIPLAGFTLLLFPCARVQVQEVDEG